MIAMLRVTWHGLVPPRAVADAIRSAGMEIDRSKAVGPPPLVSSPLQAGASPVRLPTTEAGFGSVRQKCRGVASTKRCCKALMT